MYQTSFAPRFAPVHQGLANTPKRLPTELLFDALGSELHACIDHVTKAEQAILDAHAQDIAGLVGPRANLVCLTTGDGIRAAQLVSKLRDPASVTLVDRSPRDATRAARLLATDRRGVPFVAVDGVSPWDAELRGDALFLGGSVIGELEPRAARAQLKRLRELVPPDGRLLVGIDLKKDAWEHERDYAAAEPFAKHALFRLDREPGATFDVDGFDYRPFIDPVHGRVELHLVSKRWQWAAVDGRWYHFDAGEPIIVMIAMKYTIEWFAAVAALGGWKLERVFLDPRRTYALVSLQNST
jgi:L-histidine Nalpha-methyltransferase